MEMLQEDLQRLSITLFARGSGELKVQARAAGIWVNVAETNAAGPALTYSVMNGDFWVAGRIRFVATTATQYASASYLPGNKTKFNACDIWNRSKLARTR